jgi:Tat protein secretion system quality control protein TatD with DNase activity
MYWDAHQHFSNPALNESDRQEWLQELVRGSIEHSILGGVHPAEWENQKKIQHQYPQKFTLSFGMHPWWIDECMTAQQESLLVNGFEFLQQSFKNGDFTCLGECGLDFSKKMNPAFFEKQKEYFELQLRMIQNIEGARIPLVCHVVNAGQDFLSLIDRTKRPELPAKITKVGEKIGMIHSFQFSLADSLEIARECQKRGFLISLSPRLLKGLQESSQLKNRIRTFFKTFASDDWVLESDAEQFSQALKILELAKVLAQVLGKDTDFTAENLLAQSTKNLKRLLSVDALAAIK